MNLIILYGPPASGKYTIAKALSEKTGYKLFHNHLTIDLLRSVLPFGTDRFFELSQEMRLTIMEEAAIQNVPGVIFTFVYEKNTDDEFIKILIKTMTKHKINLFFFQIYCDKNELLKRVKEESRKAFHKIKTEEELTRYLAQGELTAAIEFVVSHRIDTTNQSVHASVAQISQIIDM